MDRPAGRAEHLVAGAGDRLANRRAGLAWIAVDLALGVGTEVIAIHPVAMLVAQRPGARQHGLGRQAAAGEPAPISWAPRPRDSARAAPPPAATSCRRHRVAGGRDRRTRRSANGPARRLDPDRFLKAPGTGGRPQLRYPATRQPAFLQPGLQPQRRQGGGGCPHFPVARVSDHGLHPQLSPLVGSLFGTLGAGKGPKHLTPPDPGLGQGLPAPVQHQIGRLDPVASGIGEGEGTTGTAQPQRRRRRTSGLGRRGQPGSQGHPEAGIARIGFGGGGTGQCSSDSAATAPGGGGAAGIAMVGLAPPGSLGVRGDRWEARPGSRLQPASGATAR